MKCTKVYNARASGQCSAPYVRCYRGLFIILLLLIIYVHLGLLYICHFTYSQSVQ